MEINLNPTLTPLFTKLAQGQGMTDEAYAVHVLEKYAVGQMRKETAELLPTLTVAELSKVREDIDIVVESKKPVLDPITVEPTEK